MTNKIRLCLGIITILGAFELIFIWMLQSDNIKEGLTLLSMNLVMVKVFLIVGLIIFGVNLIIPAIIYKIEEE